MFRLSVCLSVFLAPSPLATCMSPFPFLSGLDSQLTDWLTVSSCSELKFISLLFFYYFCSFFPSATIALECQLVLLPNWCHSVHSIKMVETACLKLLVGSWRLTIRYLVVVCIQYLTWKISAIACSYIGIIVLETFHPNIPGFIYFSLKIFTARKKAMKRVPCQWCTPIIPNFRASKILDLNKSRR